MHMIILLQLETTKMTRPKNGTEEKFKQLLESYKIGMSENIKHYKDYYSECSKYKIGHAITKFKKLVNCDECLKRINDNADTI